MKKEYSIKYNVPMTDIENISLDELFVKMKKLKSYEKEGCVYTFSMDKNQIFMNDKERELHLCQELLTNNEYEIKRI